MESLNNLKKNSHSKMNTFHYSEYLSKTNIRYLIKLIEIESYTMSNQIQCLTKEYLELT